jgi:cobalt-zinc-cadmium efflux system protein
LTGETVSERDQARERGAVSTGLAVSSVLCVTELVGGWLTNSLALLTDAAHMFTDVAALALTLFALWVAGRPASDSKTFGYARAEILAALVNGVVLCVLVLLIVLEAWARLQNPPAVRAGSMLVIAVAGLLVNVFVAVRLREHQASSLNLRGAYLHVLSDLLGSLGAIGAGVVILVAGWNAVDPLVSLLIAGLILFSSWKLVREAVDVLMEAVPPHVDVERLAGALAAVPGVEEVHDLHVWTLTTGRYALSAHVVARHRVGDDGLLGAMTEVCWREFGIEHTTIQVEHESRRPAEPAACADRQPRVG